MRSDRPTDGSGRPLVAGRWARAAIVPILLAGALASSAPAAPSPKGKAPGGQAAPGQAQVPPGQAKKADAARMPDASPAPVAAANPQSRPKADAKPKAKTDKAAAQAEPTADANPAPRSEPAAAARSDDTSAAATTAKAASVEQPATAPEVATATPVAAISATPVTSPQTAPATPAAQALPVAGSRRATKSTRSLDMTVRGAPRARDTLLTRADVPVPLARAAAVPPAATRFTDKADGVAAPAEDRSPLTRTVVRVLEVIPPEIRVALAALALLGLLLGATTALQTVRSRRLVRQRRLLLADVGVLQSALLPDLPERIGGARVTAAYRPAAGLAAGGDFYDAFELPGGRTAVIVGDVAGHGRDAVPLTALVRYNLRAYLEAGLAPRATLDVASNVLAAQLGGRQVTIVVAIFDPGTGRLTYACAGHWPPLLLGTTAMLVTACSSPPIGAGVPTGRRQTTVALPPGAAACFLTDGLGEVPIAHGRRLGRDGVAEELRAVGADGDAGDLIARVVRRSDAQPDDMAACIVTALPGGAEHWALQLEELEVDDAMLRGGWVEQFLLACGAAGPQLARALAEAGEMVGLAGSAIVEVRIGEQLLEVRVGPPPAVGMPIARRRIAALDLAATG